MSFYDIVMLVVFIGAIWFGYWKGLAWQIASLAAIVVSYIVSVNFRDQVSGLIQTGEPWNRIGAMLILFLGTSIIIWSIYASVAKSLKKSDLKGFDRQAGAMLGAFKGALLCMVVTMFSVSLLGEQAHESIDHSKLGPYVESGIWKVSALVPAEIAKFVDPHLNSYKEAAGHGEPVLSNPFAPENTSSYPIDGGSMAQNPNQLPPSNPPSYQGQWQTPGTQPAIYGSQQQQNQQPQYQQPQYQQPNYQQPQTNQQTIWNPSATQPSATQTGTHYGGIFSSQQQPASQTNAGFGNFDITDATREILTDASRTAAQEAIEAVKQRANDYLNGQPGQQR